MVRLDRLEPPSPHGSTGPISTAQASCGPQARSPRSLPGPRRRGPRGALPRRYPRSWTSSSARFAAEIFPFSLFLLFSIFSLHFYVSNTAN